MDNIAVANINSFGSTPKADVPQSEESIFVLTSSQLRDIISQAVAEATKSVYERLSLLEADTTTLKAEIVDLRASGEAEIERVCVDIATDRRRLATLEESRITPTKKTMDHLDELERMMSEDKSQQVSIAKGARLLGISKERMRQLKPMILQDGRFELAWDRQRGQPRRVVIRLKQYICANTRHGKFGIGIAD